MKKDNHDDVYGPDGPEVEPALLLRYLIQKSEELSQGRYRGFPLSFQIFGLIVLDPFPELEKEFMEIVSESDSNSVNERARRCTSIFIDALARPQDRTPKDHSEDDGEGHPLDRVIASRFAWAARRLGEEMIGRKDFEFMPVWEVMTWVALREDAEKYKDFQERCRLYTDPAVRIEQVTPILREAVRAKLRKN